MPLQVLKVPRAQVCEDSKVKALFCYVLNGLEVKLLYKTKGEFFTLQRELQQKQREVMTIESETNLLRVEKAKTETRIENLEQEMTVELKERVERIKSEANANEAHPHPETLLPEIQKLRYSLEMVGGIDAETIKEYEETSGRYEFLESQAVDLKSATQSLRDMI